MRLINIFIIITICFFKRLKFPPEMFEGKKVIDFGCGTGEPDVVMANWGAYSKRG